MEPSKTGHERPKSDGTVENKIESFERAQRSEIRLWIVRNRSESYIIVVSRT